MSKVDTLREKYKSIRNTTFKSLSDGDVTPTKKYLDRMCHYWVNKGINRLYLKTLISVIKDFDDHIHYIENKDIYHPYYNDFNKLLKVVEDAKFVKFEKEFNRDEHVTVIYESDNYLALIPKTFKGSVKYGSNTRWCTAGKNYEKTFKNYINHSHLIYLINKTNKNYKSNKMAILKPKNKGIEGICESDSRFYNPNDDCVNIRWFVNNGWDEDELVKIFFLINIELYKKDKFNLIKDKTKTTIKNISEINLIELVNNLNILTNVDLLCDREMEDHKKTINDFVSKITEITKIY